MEKIIVRDQEGTLQVHVGNHISERANVCAGLIEVTTGYTPMFELYSFYRVNDENEGITITLLSCKNEFGKIITTIRIEEDKEYTPQEIDRLLVSSLQRKYSNTLRNNNNATSNKVVTKRSEELEF